MRLENIVPGLVLRGLTPSGTVTVVQVEHLGSTTIDLTYRDETGRVDHQLVFAEEANRLEPVSAARAFAFDADPEHFRLASEALRIHLAHLFDPHLAVYSSLIEPLPHQIVAVYGEMLGRQPLRFLLADDPGAGKTIMAGLLIKELMLRGDLRRCLVVCPGALADQWRDELWDKFGLRFDTLSKELLADLPLERIVAEHPLLVARLDKLSRDEDLQAKLERSDWDLVIVDEAHKMSASFFGGEVKETKRYKLGKLLSRIARNFLLLTATPHNGKEEDFQLFMALLDGDRFEGRFRDGVHVSDVSDLMRRTVKEDMYRFDGTHLFPERIATTVSYELSDAEAALYKAVTDYVREEFNRAEALENGGRRGTVGFALTILQRRLASSPEAIYQSLKRRRERLERRLREERMQAQGAEAQACLHEAGRSLDDEDIDEIEDDLPGGELEVTQEEIADQATAARTIAELAAEIETLGSLEAMALRLRQSGEDRKWDELRKLLQDHTAMFDPTGARRKLVVFTEHRDTLQYLVREIRTLLGRPEAVVSIDGGTAREERRAIQERFLQDKEVHILVATDAAGEGINLQRAHLMVNYDLPWNPNRIEQRFGRIHRIGQTEVCHLWNLVAEDTREGEVYLTLLKKLEAEREALGSGVFDVLGKALSGKELRELMLEAIRYGERPDVRDRLRERVAQAFEHETLLTLMEERALSHDVMDRSQVERVREEMERASAQRLQPHYVSAFFRAGFQHLGGSIRPREAGRYEITHVPLEIRRRDRLIGSGAAVLERYERVTFEKERMRLAGAPEAELIAPGHPLLQATLDLVVESYRPLLRQGAVLVAPGDAPSPEVLLYLEQSILGGRAGEDGRRRLVHQELRFAVRTQDGTLRPGGAAPYLDLRPPTEEEQTLLQGLLADPSLAQNIEQGAVAYAAETMLPERLQHLREERRQRLRKVWQAVRDRLTKEMNYWDHRAHDLALREQAGKTARSLNAEMARRRADDLQLRLKEREADLKAEEFLAAQTPRVLGAALVVSEGVLTQLRGMGVAADPTTFAHETKRVEQVAMVAVMAAEKALGHEPVDVSRENRGYDVESRLGRGRLRFLEVKGRIAGAETVTVTANEIRTALNRPEDFILALVSVHPEGQGSPEVRYVRNAFDREPGFAEASVNFKWAELWRKGVLPFGADEEADRGRAAAQGDQ